MMNKCLLGAFCLLLSFQSFANTKAQEAQAAYAKRDFNQEGIKNAQEAVTLYAEAVAVESDEAAKLQLMLDQATAHYFLGTALENKDNRKQAHQEAMDLSDAVMSAMGVDPESAHELNQAQVDGFLNQMDEQEELFFAEAMYNKGINLAQWGNLNGIASSIGKLPVVLGLMDRIVMLGYKEIHEYGPNRTKGRIKFTLPKILGGDLDEAEALLKEAYRNSLVEGQRYSINGYNNIYYAETLHKMGKETQAKRLLDIFLKADPATLKPDSAPENAEALRVAQDLSDSWQ